jgi:serine phosphatase RsbU (regulator of sigma subunit)
MEYAARQFARRVLLAHASLLLVVLLAVGLAAKYLYHSARQQVITQAQATQNLLAVQTATGIDHYYESIINVLNLLDPNEAPPPATQPGRPNQGPGLRPGNRPPGEQMPNRRRNLENNFLAGFFNRVAQGVWEQIKDKSSMMFFVDAMDDMRVARVIGKDEDDHTDPADVVKTASKFLADTLESRKKAISPFYPNISGGAHLVVVPRQGGLILVAVLPVENVERKLLDLVNRSETTGTMLVDDQGTFISSSFPGVRGKSIDDLSDPEIRATARRHMANGTGNADLIEIPLKIGDVQLKRAMVTIKPLKILSNKTWFVIISSDLNDVDKLVMPIFRDAMTWAIVLTVAVVGILISTAVQMIRTRLKLERAQMDLINKELAQARQIQLNWLPDAPLSLRGIEIAAVNQPASHVSGDFYNWFELPDGRIVVTIGDVTGHGMSAAFLMATTQLLVRTTMPRITDPGQCMEEVNRQLCTQVFNGQFVTMMIAVLDLDTRTIEIASAGHPAPMLCDNDGARALDLDPQLVLGVEESVEYPTQRYPLNPGARLLFYTDGVPDAESADGKRFTAARIQQSLACRLTSPKSMLDTVMQSIDQFRIGRDLSDDLTLVAIQFEPGSQFPESEQLATGVQA